MKRSCSGVFSVLLLLLAVPGQCASGVQLFASQFEFPTTFYSVNPDTGLASAIGPTTFVPGLDFRRNGVLYGSSSSLWTVNTGNGAATLVGQLPELIRSIGFGPDDKLYGVANNGDTLYEIDPRTGASLRSVAITGTTHSSGTPFPGEISGIDFAPDGTLYGIGFGLYTINPLTGVATRVTPLGQQVSGDLFLDLDYGPDGRLRAVTFESDAAIYSDLYTIDSATGSGLLVGSMGADIAGLASVPEPSTYALLVAGVLSLYFARKSLLKRAD